MKKERVFTDYSQTSDFELSSLAGRILRAMEDPVNVENFPNPTPTLEAFNTMVEDYIRKHEIASNRGSGTQIGAKNESRVVLLDEMRTLAQYVNRVANGRISLLLGTGFSLIPQPTNNLAPLTSRTVRLRDGRHSGQVRVDIDPVKSAWEYEIQVGPINATGEIDWTETLRSTSSRGVIVNDRMPGTRYAVRVRARNGKGYGDWTEPVSMIAR